MKSSLFSLFLVPAVLLSGLSFAGENIFQEEDAAKKAYFDSFRKKKNSRVKDLLITANYQSCAIIAGIARKVKGTPCILLPAAGDKKGKIWFIPAKNNGILAIDTKELGKFISFLAPERILILGDELIVPERFRPLSGSHRPAVNILSHNWRYNALVLGNYLGIYDMQERYDSAMKNNVVDPFTRGLDAPRAEETEKKPAGNEKKKTDAAEKGSGKKERTESLSPSPEKTDKKTDKK